MAQALKAAEAARDVKKQVLHELSLTKNCSMDTLTTAAEVSEIDDNAVTLASKMLDDRVIDIPEQTNIASLKNCASDHNKIYVCQAIRSTLQDMLASLL